MKTTLTEYLVGALIILFIASVVFATYKVSKACDEAGGVLIKNGFGGSSNCVDLDGKYLKTM